MAVIKSSEVPAELETFSLRDIEMEAAAIIQQAQQQAAMLLEQARQEADELRARVQADAFAEAHADGLAAGTEAGMRQGEARASADQARQLRCVVECLTATIEQMEKARTEAHESMIPEAVELALAVARKVTKRQAEIDPLVLTANLSEAMRLVVHGSELRIAVNPEQKHAIDQALPALRTDFPALNHAHWIEDPHIAPGGCRVFTRNASVDADLDGQLSRIVADLIPAQETAA